MDGDEQVREEWKLQIAAVLVLGGIGFGLLALLLSCCRYPTGRLRIPGWSEVSPTRPNVTFEIVGLAGRGCNDGSQKEWRGKDGGDDEEMRDVESQRLLAPTTAFRGLPGIQTGAFMLKNFRVIARG
ncbi:hypothetical protein T439DRAFT_321160 [Meredithblackwellia eburnea MCA 4105]